MTARPVRVVLVEAEPALRAGLRMVLGVEGGVTVVAEAGSAQEALAAVGRTRPDVAVIGASVDGGSLGDLCGDLRDHWPCTSRLLLLLSDDDSSILTALDSGSAVCAPHAGSTADLVEAVRRAATGQVFLDRRSTELALHLVRTTLPQDPGGTGKRLTPREQEVLACLGDGLSNRQISQRLGLAEKTVRNVVSNVLGKLGVPLRAHAVAWAASRAAS